LEDWPAAGVVTTEGTVAMGNAAKNIGLVLLGVLWMAVWATRFGI
jgi:hypothetical protein